MRVLQSSTYQIAQTWYAQDGTPTDPGAVTVQIDRDDGTSLVAAGTATAGTGVSARTFTLTTAHTGLLDRLKVTWTSATLGNRTAYVEVVGGFVFSIAEARALTPLDSTALYPAAAIEGVRELVEVALEDACGVAFVPRYRRETLDATWSYTLRPKRGRITAIRSVKVDGVALAPADLAQLKVTQGGLIYRPTGWTSGNFGGVGAIEVAYEHGYPSPPPRVGRAALRVARRLVVDSPSDERMTTMTTEDGTFSMVVAGVRNAIFDIPEANAVVQQYDESLLVA